MLKQYIRNKKNEKIGMITATIEGNNALIGFSKCKKTDKFNRDIGEIVADVRAKATFPLHHVVGMPHDIWRAIPSFLKNHEFALAGKNLPVWAQHIGGGSK